MAQQDREPCGRRKHTLCKKVTGDGGEVAAASASWFLNVPVLDPGDTWAGGAHPASRGRSPSSARRLRWHFGSSGDTLLAPSRNTVNVTCAHTSLVLSVSLGLKQ